MNYYKAFNCIQLYVAIGFLNKRQVPDNIINMTENVYTDNQVELRISGELLKPISVSRGVTGGFLEPIIV